MRFGNERMPQELLTSSPETIIYDFFRDHFNHFDVLERAAEALREEELCEPYEMQNISNNAFYSSRHNSGDKACRRNERIPPDI